MAMAMAMAMTWKALSVCSGRGLSLTRARWQSTTTKVIATNATNTKDEELQDTIFGVPLSKSSYNAGLLNALSLENASAPERRAVRKLDIVKKFQRGQSDTGSPEIQIALMTDKINDLTAHLQRHRKDVAKKRSMAKAVGQRRRMMRYLLRTSPERYMAVVKELDIRPNSVFGGSYTKGAKKRPTRNLSFDDGGDDNSKTA